MDKKQVAYVVGGATAWSLLTAILLAVVQHWFGPSVVLPPLPVPPGDKIEQTPPAPPKPSVQTQFDPSNAIHKVIMQRGYCSGTIVAHSESSVLRPDKRLWVVSAAHCFGEVGNKVQHQLRDGRTLVGTVCAIDRGADCALVITDPITESFGVVPYTTVASIGSYSVGNPVWHQGFGVHIPGNKEIGKIADLTNQRGQVRYRLSVSQGDSGGGIIHDATGRLLSPVCCTTQLNAMGDVWGAAPERILRMMATPTDYVDVQPIEMPVVAPDAVPGKN